MTPVEERIDHEEAKRIAKRFVANASLRLEIPFFPDPEDTVALARAYLALLTEHSAREEVLSRIAFLLDPATGSPRPTEALRVARRALPATEPAQPEEEPDG